MKKVLAMALLVGAFGVVGCNTNKKQAEATAPPPPPLEPAPMVMTPPPPMPTYVEPVPVAPAAPAGGRTYIVQRGDTLYGIARREYGDVHRVRDIIAANPGINPNVIKVGQRINLP